MCKRFLELLLCVCPFVWLASVAIGAEYTAKVLLDARTACGNENADASQVKLSDSGYVTGLLGGKFAFLWHADSVAYLTLPKVDNPTYIFRPSDRGEVVLNHIDSSVPTVCVWRCPDTSRGGKAAFVDLGDGKPLITAVNSSGAAVGYCHTPSLSNYPFVITNGRATILPYYEDLFLAYAYGINQRGDVVGQILHRYSEDNPRKLVAEACCWRGGEVVFLGMLEGCEKSSAKLVNSKGQVVVESSPDSSFVSRWSLWTNGAHQEIVLPDDARNCVICGLNDSGQVIGQFCNSQNITCGFLWAKGKLTLLTIPQDKPIVPKALNNKGQIVGNQGQDAYLWENGAAHALPKPVKLTDAAATDINSSGVIAGTCNRRVAIVWTPVAEPDK